MQFTDHSWVVARDQLAAMAVRGRARFGSLGAFIEGDELTQQAQADGLAAQAIPAYLTTKDYWPRLGVSAAGHLRRGEVKIVAGAVDRTERQSFPPLNYAGEERSDDDPTIAAFLYGIALALDESAAVDPKY